MFRKTLLTSLVFIALFSLWELYSHLNSHLAFVLPAPSRIFCCIWSRFDRLTLHAIATIKEMVGGIFFAMLMAFPLAWAMYLWHVLRSVLQPLFIVIQCIPMFALAPIMVFWFDWSYTAIVLSTTLMIFFPLTINVYQGLCSTPRALLDYFRVNQATSWQTFCKLQLPWSLPHLIAGFRISAAIAGIGAVAGEWAGAQQGLGLLMLESRRSTDLEMTFAALFCLTFISLSFYGFTLFLEKILIRRHRQAFFKNFQKITLGGIFPLLFLLSCGQPSNKTSHQMETHMILDWLPNPNHVPLFAGIEKGFFREKGIDLKITKIADPGDTVSFLSSGKVDLALYYMPETYLAIKQGAELLPVGFLVKQPLNAFIYRKELGIQKPEDLSGKKLGYVVGGFGLNFLNNILARNHVDPKEKFNVSFDLVGTLGTQRVDVIYGAYWNIESEHLKSLGIETGYLPLEDFGHPTYYELLIIANKGTPYATPEFVENFKLALQKSIDYSIANSDEAFALYSNANRDKSEKTLAWEKSAWLKTSSILAHDQINEEKVWDDFSRWIETNRL